MTRFIFFFLIITSFVNAQSDETMEFEIDFELNLDERVCYDYATEHSTNDIDLSFYLIYSWPVKGNIKEIGKSTYRMKGQFTYLVSGPGAHFYPILVIMAEPRFEETENCDNVIKVYFVNLNVLYSKEPSENFGYEMKKNIGKINLSDNPYIKASMKNDKVFFEYSNFYSNIRSDGLDYGMDKWLRL